MLLLPLLLAADATATASSITPPPPPPPSATVNTTTYTGLVRNGVDVFLGIRYGHDTSGAHRFRPPRAYAPPPGTTTLAATEGGPGCAQADSDAADISEDCLRLNVVRPAGSRPGSRHAVMVYIHGGGFWEGAKDEVLYEPDGAVLESVRSGQPIVHVAINYRLNVFGFAQHPDLLAEGSTNIGLRDQRLALEWVRAHIAQFGGDPSRVTIYGQSSGGLSVGMHLLAHDRSSPTSASSPPFQRAIMQSTALEEGITGTYTAEATARVLTASNCTAAADQVACLRALPVAALVAAAADTYTAGPDRNIGDVWLPQVDGDFLPDAPEALVRAGRFAKNVSAIFGWCEDDMTVSTPDAVRTPAQTRQVIGDYLRGQAAAVVDGLVALYPASEFRALGAEEYYRTARIIRDLLMVCPPVMYARHLAAAAASPGQPSSVFLYNWNQTMHPASPLRVTHASELAYVFGNLSHPDLGGDGTDSPAPADARLRDRATRSWSAFANVGRPNQGSGVFDAWKPAFGGGGGSSSKGRGGGQVFIAGGPAEGMVDLAGYERLGERCAYIEKYVNTD